MANDQLLTQPLRGYDMMDDTEDRKEEKTADEFYIDTFRPQDAAGIVDLFRSVYGEGCAGFFTIHASSVGALNQKLTSGQRRANALYILFYYPGGWTGITTAGFAYKSYGWCGVVAMGVALLTLPFYAGLQERKKRDHSSESFLESIP